MTLVADRLAPGSTRTAAHDDRDPIGSNSSTPPGVMTPRPDLTDKRLPGIMHSYFGQVRFSLRTRPRSVQDPAPVPPTSPEREGEAGEQKPGFEGLDGSSSPLPSHGSSSTPRPDRLARTQTFGSYVSPPILSSSLSVPHIGADERADGPRLLDRNLPSDRAFSDRSTNLSAKVPTDQTRRQTLSSSDHGWSPVAAPIAGSTRKSNPASESSPPKPSNPFPSHPTLSRRPSGSQATDDSNALTQGCSTRKHAHSTPPQTPRTQSQEEEQQQQVNITCATSALRISDSKSSSSSTASVLPPKGKLLVSISEGRNLRPSVDPYVVCQFQWAEYISEGPINGEPSRPHAAMRRDGLGGIAIKRTQSDQGRPMAIPMTSRQNSNTSVNDSREPKAGGMVTDPKWEHEAML